MRNLALLISAALLSGCGGGGSDGGADNGQLRVYSSTNQISLEGVLDKTKTVEIKIDSTGIAQSNVYVRPSSGSDNVTIDSWGMYDARSGYVTATVSEGALMPAGKSSHDVWIDVCFDYYCQQPVVGSPIRATINYYMDKNEQVTLTSDDSSIIYKGAVDAYPINDNLVHKQITITGSNTSRLYFQKDPQHQLVTNVSVTPTSGYQHDVAIDLRLPSSLEVGRQQQPLDLKVCYDKGCKYQVKGSPLRFTIDYLVEGATRQAPAMISVGERQALSHNVTKSAFVPGLNVIAMLSNSPENALYLYDIDSNKTHRIALSQSPLDLSVDKLAKQGRIVVSQEYSALVVDYNKATPANTKLKHVQLDTQTHNVVIRRDDLYSGGGNLEHINVVNQQTHRTRDSDFYCNEMIKLSPFGDAIYAQSRSCSPRKFSRVDLTDKGWSESNIEESYHGDYHYGDNFWFDKNGMYYYSIHGDFFHVARGNSYDMKHAGLVPVSTYAEGGYFERTRATLNSLYDTGDHLLISEEQPINKVRILDKLTLSELESFAETTTNVEGIEYKDRPLLAVETSQGAVFAVKQTYRKYSVYEPEPISSYLIRLK